MTRNAVVAAFLFIFSVLAVSIFSHPAQALAAPVVTGTTPSSVPSVGGDTVTIIGTGFEPTSTVEINGISTTSAYVDAQTITFTSVATVVGAKRVTVVNADGQRFNLQSGLYFYELAPSLSGITPNQGAAAGGQSISLTGSNFSLGKKQLTNIAEGDYHTCGLYEGAVYCWGYNNTGQLGNNTLVNSLTPVAVDTSGVLKGKTVVSVSAGSNSSCAITSEGKLFCWGQNQYGQIGDNTTTTARVPTAVVMSGALINKTVLSVDIGVARTCLVASDNNAYCWGRNFYGQLGNGNTTDSLVPVAVVTAGALSGKSVKQISTGTDSTCAVTTDGLAFCWGRNDMGQTGNGTTTASSVPVATDTSGVLNGKTLVSIATGTSHSCTITTEGRAYCWGSGAFLGTGTNTASTIPIGVNMAGALAGKTLLSLSISSSYTCGVASDNNGYCWGINSVGQLGNNSSVAANAPVVVTRTGALTGLSLLSVEAGINHTCVVASNNQSYCWGANAYGQLGDGTVTNVLTAVASNVMTKATLIVTIGGISASNPQLVSSTSITANTPFSTSGSKNVSITQYDSQTATLANGYTYIAPPAISNLTPSTGSVAGGDTVTITGTGFDASTKIRLDDAYLSSVNLVSDTIITFITPTQTSGRNVEVIVEDAMGQQSDSSYFNYTDIAMTIFSVSPDSGPITGGGAVTITGTNFTIGIKDISQITAGSNFACGVYNGDAYCWGLANRLGSGTAGSTVPVAVTKTGVLAGKTIKQIDAGGSHTCAIASDDQAYCWGIGTNGQLGNASTSNGNAPVAVSKAGALAGKTIKSISAGDSYTCAIASDDKAYCWGNNGSGQLGTSTTSQSSIPVAVATGALTGKTIKSISASSISTCVIASDDQVYCWGTNTSGQLGTGNTNLSYTPIAVVKTGAFAGKTIKSISAGTSHACAIASDDLPYCWGDNNVGQMGTGDNADVSVPTAVVVGGALTSKTIKKIELGGNGSCSVASDNKAYCWGANTAGQLGIGTAVNSNVPVAVSTSGALANKSIRSVSFGVTFACAVTTSNKSFCWGAGTSGQLGNGSTTASNVPNAVTQVSSNEPTVTMGGIATTNVQRISDTSLTATIPAHAAGATDTSVSRYDNTTVTAVNSYTYGATPSISSVSPNKAPKAGGDTITLTGSFFNNVTSVKVGANDATNISIINSTTLTFTAPAVSVAGAVDIIITDSYGQTSTLLSGFTYQNAPMTISALNPTGGPTAGGQTVAFTGTNFFAGARQLSKVSSGEQHTCGIYEQQAYCWGINSSGELGNSGGTNSSVPVAVTNTGVLAGKTIKTISASNDHTCVIASDDLPYCWGSNAYGQLGNSSTNMSRVPVAVTLSGVLAGKTVKSIQAGYIHTCVIASDDKAYCWGYNSRGQLGNGSTATATSPVAVTMSGALTGKTVKSMSSKMYHSCIIASDDVTYCWGNNDYGQLGNSGGASTVTPTPISTSGALSGKTLKSIETGWYTTCGLSTENLVYCWGDATDGKLGNPSIVNPYIPNPITTSGDLNGKTVASLTMGDFNACVITTENKAYCWGQNNNGQLGTGNQTAVTSPTLVHTDGALVGKTITSISNSRYHSCAQASDNQAYCWGSNSVGQLGNSATVDSLTSVAVTTVATTKVMTVSFGGSLATNVQILSPTQMTAVTPAHTAGVTNVVATSYDDQVVAKTSAYTYAAAPVASSIAPSTGLVSGGDTVTLTGSSFSGNLKVKIGGDYSPSVTVINGTTLTFVTPAVAKPGVFNVTVEDDYGMTSTLTNAFTYRLADPTLSSVSPVAGPMGGGTTITVTGTGFVNNPDGATWYQVRVGGVLATSVAYVNSTTLTAVAPAGTIGVKDVTVSGTYNNTVTLANSYTYNAQSYAFTNTALNLSKEEAGTLTITARNASGQLVVSPVATTVTLATTSAGGAFARNLTEDIATRWTYTSVIIPAGQSSVNVYYKDTTAGTPTITGTVAGMTPFTQVATISSPYRFTVTGVSDPIKAGVPSSVTIRVTDKNGNQRTDYTGTINFSSTDPAATVPASYTMKSTDYGIKTFTNGVTMGSVGEYCVVAEDSIDSAVARGQQCSITVQAPNSGTISQLAIITPEQRVTAGHFSSPITIQSQDTNGISIPVTADKSIFLYSPSATGEFSTDGLTWSGSMPVGATIKAGSSSVNVYFRDSAAHTTTVRAMDNAGEATGGDFGWLNANQSITTGLSPPTKMRITGLQAMVSGQKSNYLVELLDDAGNLVSTDSDVTIRVDSDTPTSRFFYPTTATTGVAGPTEFTIPSGLTGATIAFSDTTISTSTDFTSLTFVDGRPMTETVRLEDATKEVQIVTALPTKITLNSILSTMEAGDSTAVDVQLLDSNNLAAPAVETTVIGLSSSTPSGEFSLTQTPFTPVSSVTINQGQSLKRVYFRDTLAGTSTLSASRAGMTATPDQVEITSSDTASFGITPLTSSTAINTASSAFTVTSYDVFGNVVIQDANLNVYPYSDQTTTRFGSSATGPWNLNPVTILAGQSSVQFYAKETVFYGSPLTLTASDKATLDNPDADIANATTRLAISGQPIASIAITSTQQTVVAGVVSNKIDIEVRQTDGSPALQNGTVVNIGIVDGKFVATNDAGAAAITSVAIAQGAATASFYYYGEIASAKTITATVSATSTTTTQPLTVQAAAPTKLVYQSPTASVAPNTPTTAIHAIIRDAFNNDATFETDKTVTLTSSCGTGTFSLSSSNWQNITAINVPAGSSDATFYYKDSTPANCTITSTIAGIAAATQQVSITSYAVETLAFTTPARTIKAGEKTGIVTVELRKADGTPAIQNGSTQLQLSIASGQFFLNAGDTTTISTVTIADGESSGSFYYSDTLAGTRSINVTMAGVATPATQQVTVTPEAPTRLVYTTQSQTVGEGEPSEDLHVAIRDMYNNASPLTSDTTVNFASTCVTGTFSEDAVDWQPVSGVLLPAGSTDVTFYYKAMIQGSCSLTISANSLSSASQTITITDSNFPIRVGLVVPSETLTKGETRSLSINLLDQNGDISPAKVRTTVYFATTSDGQFTPGAISFNVGESSKTVNYKNNVSGQVTVYARDQNDSIDAVGSLADTSATLNYIEGAAASVGITGATTSQTGALVPITATLLNGYGISVVAASDTAVNFTSNRQTGSFFDADGNATTQITIPAWQSQANINYRQSEVGVAVITGQSAGLGQSAHNISFVAAGIAEIRFINSPTTLEVGVPGTYRVGLYDEFGNVVTATSPVTLYVRSDATSETSGGGQFTIQTGASNASFTYKQNTIGPFSLTVSDTQDGTVSIVDPITATGNAIVGNPKSFKFTPGNALLERGGVTDAINVELLNANDQLTPATNGGQLVYLGMPNGAGKYSTTRNGNFTSQLTLTVPAGQTSAAFYYRNDTGAVGVQTLPGQSVFGAATVTKTGTVTVRYGEPTQLVYLNEPISVDQYSPSAALTIQQQNQYGIAVPVTGDKTIFLTSSAATGRFGSSKVDWDVSSITMQNGSSTASFYYQDTVDGGRTITASDTLPLTPDVLLVNAVQSLSVLPSSNIPRIVNNFLVTNISDPQAQGTQSSLVLIARDVDGYIVENYNGTVTFSSDDLDAQLPETYTFIPAIDKGVHVFTNQVAFTTEGEKTVFVTDANGIEGQQSEITVGEGNTNPITALVITQPESPVTIAPNTTSPNITVELRDGAGVSTNAPVGGINIRVTSTTSTGQFATSTSGPWLNTMVINIPEGIGYANVYYRDSAVGNATITASDWDGAVDTVLIDNANLDVLIHRTYVDGQNTIQTLNALGEYEASAQLFARNGNGAITGKVTNNFSSRNLVNDQLVAVDWRTKWRQGVTLLKSDTATDQTNFAVNVDPVQTIAGASDFYAVAETTETTFADTYGIVSKQLQTVVSPWKTSIDAPAYALDGETIDTTMTFRSGNALTSPTTATIFLLAADATNINSAVYIKGFASPSSTLEYSVPAGTATLGGQYKILAVTYDANGNTSSQVVSEPFTVLETAPVDEIPPATPVAPTTPNDEDTPTTPADDTVAPVVPVVPVVPLVVVTPVNPTPGNGSEPLVEGANNTEALVTAGIVATYATTIFVGVFLIRESYKEWARIRRIRSVLKREAQLAKDKDTFLSLASHYLRTPITILDATSSMVPAIQSVVATLRSKADVLLENGAASSLAEITSPDIEKITRSAFKSIYFWLPIIVSIALTIAVTLLFNAAGAGVELNNALVYTVIIIVALALIIGFGARTVFINKEIENAKETMSLHRAQLFNAKTNFIMAMQSDLSNEIGQLKMTLTNNGTIPENIKAIIQDASGRLEQLVSKLTIAAQINGMAAQTETFTPQALVQSSVQRLQTTIQDKKLVVVEQYDENAPVAQDQRLLRYVTGTVLDNAVMFSKPGSIIDIDTSKNGKSTQVSITNEDSSFGSVEKLTAMFEPFNHATHENDLTVEGMGLSLYLDKLIMEHLGGTISASSSTLHHNASINITFPSVK